LNIKISANSLLNIINDILDISKLESGKTVIEIKKIDVKNMIEEAVLPLSYIANKKGVKISYEIEKSVPQFIMGDKTKISQILINIVGNAVKFTEVGKIQIKIKGKTLENKRIELEFIVEDTGIGISEGIQKKLFFPFVQGDSSYTKKYQGTGLGLAICKKLTELMEGNISLESSEGKGSKFRFTIVVKSIE